MGSQESVHWRTGAKSRKKSLMPPGFPRPARRQPPHCTIFARKRLARTNSRSRVLRGRAAAWLGAGGGIGVQFIKRALTSMSCGVEHPRMMASNSVERFTNRVEEYERYRPRYPADEVLIRL